MIRILSWIVGGFSLGLAASLAVAVIGLAIGGGDDIYGATAFGVLCVIAIATFLLNSRAIFNFGPDDARIIKIVNVAAILLFGVLGPLAVLIGTIVPREFLIGIGVMLVIALGYWLARRSDSGRGSNVH